MVVARRHRAHLPVAGEHGVNSKSRDPVGQARPRDPDPGIIITANLRTSSPQYPSGTAPAPKYFATPTGPTTGSSTRLLTTHISDR